MSKAGIERTLQAAWRHELRAYVSCAARQRFSNSVGRGDIRSANAAQRHFTKAKQLRLGLEMRIESESSEKKRRLADATKEIRKVAPWNKKKRAA